MQIVLLHKHFSEKHLIAVKNEMQLLGPPIIQAIWSECYGMWIATEGCHRIRAAHQLGLIPKIEDVTESERVIIQIDGIDEEVDTLELLEELQDTAYQSEIVDFDED